LQCTRIAVVEMPRMLRDIVAETIAMEPDMEVVAEFSDATSVASSNDRMAVEVVVVGRDDRSLADLLLAQHPQLKIFAVANHGRESSLYEMRPQRVPLGETSPQRLVEEIRKAVREHANG
jgi:DNA-binding NarL/FixJ family response regulator